MTTAKEIVDHYIGEFREGRCDNAFHGLIDLNPELIPELIEAYDSSDVPELKVFVIKVISEFRKEPALYFLRHALRRDEVHIWKSALDGLAMVELQASVDAMEHVLSSVADAEKRAWIQQVISDTIAAIKNKSPQIPSVQSP
ncbi:MAG: hypothetical protein V4675_00605 [Verrucomicrobiota bacterium]